MHLVGSNRGFEVYFSCHKQSYTVFKDGKFLIGGACRFAEVKSYLD